MQPISLSLDYKSEAAQLKGRHAAPSHADQTIDRDTVVIAPPDGHITAVLLTQAIGPELYNRAYELWKTVDELPSNRATAAGSPSLPRLKNDGTVGERRGVPKHVLQALAGQGVAHGSIGNLDATPDQPCHKTPLSKNRPEMLDGNERLVKLVDDSTSYTCRRFMQSSGLKSRRFRAGGFGTPCSRPFTSQRISEQRITWTTATCAA